ncbi:MAG TPA: DUF4129 domain-containing protein [Kineosporiaceae bacterium]
MTPPLGAVPVLLAPLRPDRDTARAWAEQELLKRDYQAERPGLLQLALRWLTDRLSDLGVPQGVDVRLGLAVLAVAVLGVTGYALWRAGGLRTRARASSGALFDSSTRTAAEHRAAADAAERSGDLATAVLERFRALVLSLAERDLVQLGPGRTADEAARSAGEALPALADRLREAAGIFDDVRYGDRPVTAEQVRQLRVLDGDAARTRPAVVPV